MIITRYLVKETLKSQLAILFILLLIFFCQKMVRILSAVVDGDIPANLVFSLLGLGVPEMAQLILPLSLFLGLLMTFGKLYMESEITVMHACGYSRMVLLKAAMILATVTGIIAMINAFWVSPWSAFHSETVTAEAKANPGIASMVEGQFQPSQDGNYVLFISDVKGKEFKDVFLAQLRTKGSQRPSVVIADSGHLQGRSDGSQRVILDKGTRYEGTALLRDFRITEFVNYEAIIGHKTPMVDASDAVQASMSALWSKPKKSFRAEFHWRLTLVFSVFVMAIMVVPLSVVNPRQGRVLSMLPAMLLYLIFFLLQSSLRSNASKGSFNPLIWVWLVNGFYLALAILLNVWDTLPVRRLRERFLGKGAV